MQPLPYDDPGTPDLRSPDRFIAWVARHQWRTIVLGVACGIVWMLSIALMPAVISAGTDAGIRDRNMSALVMWSLALVGLGILGSIVGTLRHRYAVLNWLQAAFRCIQLVGEHATVTGEALPRAMPTGQVVASAATDATRFAQSFDVFARFAGGLVSYLVVAVILLRSSLQLGLVVLLGVPLLLVTLAGVITPLQRRQADQREESGTLSELGADTVVGLRVLRGIGGEDTFRRRYTEQSGRVRTQGVRVAVPQSTLDSAQVLLPGIFMVVVTWLGARAVHAGSLTPGQLVAFYGYSTFLVIPLSTATEMTSKFLATRVAASRIIRVLQIEGDQVVATTARQLPAGPQMLCDPSTQATFEPGLLTAVVSETPGDTAGLADRLGRFGRAGTDVTFGGVAITDAALSEVRSRIVISHIDPQLFAGTLHSELDPTSANSVDQIAAALDAADAHDVLLALEDGLDSRVEERGRSFSGGGRQRLALVRALLTNAETLVLVEPTSAVDAHTEARIASRLREIRAGRTTIVMATSPLLLDRADRVLLLQDGRVVASGTHTELNQSSTAYRRVVLRGEEDADEPARS